METMMYPKLNLESDFADTPFAKHGRALAHLGVVMQDKNSTIRDIASAAHDAGLNLYFKIQPSVEDSRDE